MIISETSQSKLHSTALCLLVNNFRIHLSEKTSSSDIIINVKDLNMKYQPTVLNVK